MKEIRNIRNGHDNDIHVRNKRREFQFGKVFACSKIISILFKDK